MTTAVYRVASANVGWSSGTTRSCPVGARLVRSSWCHPSRLAHPWLRPDAVEICFLARSKGIV